MNLSNYALKRIASLYKNLANIEEDASIFPESKDLQKNLCRKAISKWKEYLSDNYDR